MAKRTTKAKVTLTREERAAAQLEKLKNFAIPKEALDIERKDGFITYVLPDGSAYKRPEIELIRL
jgi:hypothetical protein